MKNPPRVRNLVLGRETIRALAGFEMLRIAGAFDSGDTRCPGVLAFDTGAASCPGLLAATLTTPCTK
jgi:hypothetical protein